MEVVDSEACRRLSRTVVRSTPRSSTKAAWVCRIQCGLARRSFSGADLTTVRDNRRHASLATTSMYLRSDDIKGASQMASVFGNSTG